MQLHHFTLTRAQLDSIPEDERVLLVLLAHAANELSVLTKLFHFASAGEGDAPILVEARNAQSLVIGRLLTGKLYECWNLLQAGFFGTRISKKYVPQFDPEGREALDSLGRYFGRNNLIELIRNNFAFHFALDQIRAGYPTLVEGDNLDVYLSRTNANTLYAFAETIAGRAMLTAINPNDPKAAFDVLIHETSQVVGWFNTFVGACMVTCLRLHVGGDLYALGAKVINVEGAPDWHAIELPYFVEIEEERGVIDA